MKTPKGTLFTVPNEALAIAVATEWDAQKDTLKFYTMHLVSLVNKYNTFLEVTTKSQQWDTIIQSFQFILHT